MAAHVSKVEVVVLGLLTDEPMYGYDLLERFRDRNMGSWIEVGRASVYQALKRLERDGSVEGRAQESTSGPDRRVFRITRAGRKRLRAGLIERFGSPAPYETDPALALGFAHMLPASEAREAVDDLERSLREQLDNVRTEIARTATDAVREPSIWTAMLERQRALAEAELTWLKTYRAALSKAGRQTSS